MSRSADPRNSASQDPALQNQSSFAELDALGDAELGRRVDATLDQALWAEAADAPPLPEGLLPRLSPETHPADPPTPIFVPRRRSAWRLAASLAAALGVGLLIGHLAPWATDRTGGEAQRQGAVTVHGESAGSDVVWRQDLVDASQLELRMSAPGVLSWPPREGATGYRLEILDVRGQVVHAEELEADPGTPMDLTLDLQDPALDTAAYLRLTATLRDGGRLTSEIVALE